MTVYGLVDVGYTTNKDIKKADGTVVAKQAGITDGGYAGNRVGFRGVEDLGNGLKANFLVEMGLTATNSSLLGPRAAATGFQYDGYATSTAKFDAGTAGAYSNNSNRQTYVGLSGDFGEVRAGYQYTTLYEISTLSGFTQTSEGVYGGSAAHTWGTGVAGGTRSNAIDYKSPRFSGVQVGLQLGSAGGRETTEFATANSATGLTRDKQKRTSFKLDYEQGPLKAAWGHTDFKNDQSARAAGSTQNSSLSTSPIINTFNVFGALTSVGAASTTGDSIYKTKMDQFAASYDFGVAKVGATINKGTHTVDSASTPAFGTGLSSTTATAAGEYKFKSQAISAIAPFGKVRLMAGFGKASWDSSTATNADLKQQQLGAMYDFSKRTVAYVYTGSFKDEKAATNYKGSQTIIGMAHSF